MRKNLNKLPSFTSFFLLFVVFSTGCSTTSEKPAEQNITNENTTTTNETQLEDSSSTKVQIVDSAKDVEVENLPITPDNNHVSIKPSAPQEYIVQKGDTLWGISSQFLNQPWFWPEIWYQNPKVQNPHLIYPGDVINIFYVGGKPYLTVNGENRTTAIERLSPVMRGEPIEATKKIIPIQVIEQFLTRPLVVGENELENSPHIAASRDRRIIYGVNDVVYLRDAADLAVDSTHTIYRPGIVFEDPDTGEVLGYEAIHVGSGKVTKEGDPASLYITDAVMEILRGDRVVEAKNVDIDGDLHPRSPLNTIEGNVIHLHNAITQTGSYQIIVANVGEQQGIQKGHVLAINKAGRSVVDPYAGTGQEERVTLPDEHSADAIVFRVFDDLSYLFILDANRPVRNGDMVSNL